jgi:hypothetical protein
MEERKIVLDLCCLLGPLELFVARGRGGCGSGGTVLYPEGL